MDFDCWWTWLEQPYYYWWYEWPGPGDVRWSAATLRMLTKTNQSNDAECFCIVGRVVMESISEFSMRASNWTLTRVGRVYWLCGGEWLAFLIIEVIFTFPIQSIQSSHFPLETHLPWAAMLFLRLSDSSTSFCVLQLFLSCKSPVPHIYLWIGDWTTASLHGKGCWRTTLQYQVSPVYLWALVCWQKHLASMNFMLPLSLGSIHMVWWIWK